MCGCWVSQGNMLVESSFYSSVETSLVNVSECENPFAACDWASLAETYQMIQKFPICSQVSFLEALPVPDAMNPNLQVNCPKTSAMHNVSEDALTSIVYRRRKWRMKPGGTVEQNIGTNSKHDDSVDNSTVLVHDHRESTKRGNRINGYLVYSRKKRRGKSNCNLNGKATIIGDELDDAFFSEHDCGETNRGNQSDNLFVYSRKKGRVPFSSCSFGQQVTGGTKISGYQADSWLITKADGAFTESKPGENKNSGHQSVYTQSKQLVNSIGSITDSHIGKTKKNGDISDCEETNIRGNRSDNIFVYSRKKGRVKFDSCSFSEHVTGGTKISSYQADSSTSSQRGLIAKADGAFSEPNREEIKNSGHQPLYSQSKQLVNSVGRITESHIGKNEKNGARTDVLLMYSRRKKKEKSIGDRVNGFLVYRRKKFKFRGPFSRHDVSKPKKSADQLPIVSSHTSSVPDKNADSISHVEQLLTAVELVDDTELTSMTCSSEGTNDIYSSLKSSSELASSSSTTDARVSETDTDGDSSPFRQCRHCDKPVTIGKMLICDECGGAYHTSCCGIRTKEVAEIDDWLCPSCLNTKSSKTKIKGRISREQKLRVTEPSVIGIRIGKEFQADVPDWSGPTMSDNSFIGEPLKIDQSEYIHDLETIKNSKKPCFSVNWLQCREEDENGDICGKWRRAPHSEVQTKNWECFRCVFWDPWRADCAVPQERETSEILKQLKEIKMPIPRSNAKRRKLGAKGRSRAHNKGKS